MRIAFIISGYPWKPWGALRVVYEYANQLVEKGIEVRVIHVRKLRHPNTPPLQGISGRLRAIMHHTRNILFKPKVTWQPIDERVKLLFVTRATAQSVPDGDAIFATAWDTVADVLELPDSKGEKCYLVQSYDTWSGKQDQVDATWRAPLYKVVVSRWLYEQGVKLGCQDMVHIPNAIDQSRFRVVVPIDQRPKRVAARYAPGTFRGMADAVAALEIARAKHPDLLVVFFGTTAAPPWVPRWIEYRRHPSQTELVERIYNGSSIFLLASWSESFSLPAAEAMACGCALVTTDCGGVREYATHEVNSLISPPKMPEELAANLIRLLDDDAQRMKLARLGTDTIRRFTWAESGNRMAAFISQRIHNASAPREKQ